MGYWWPGTFQVTLFESKIDKIFKMKSRSLRTPFYRGADCGILVYSKNDSRVSPKL